MRRAPKARSQASGASARRLREYKKIISGTRISATLVVDAERAVACAACGHALGPAGEPWKPHARLDEQPIQGTGGAPYTNAERVLLRRFFCPGCGALLDTESALAGDPFLTDIVRV